MKLFISLLIGITSFTSISYGQSSNKKKVKRTVINFDDELIEGDVSKPELSYLLQKKQFNFGKLIKLRENFLPEMNSTSQEIERGR